MPKILVVGDAMLDRYVYGHCPRLSPEAPVPIMRVTSQTLRPGGACNVAMNVQSLGIDCRLLSIVGQDQAAKDLVSTMQSQLSHFHLQQTRAKTTVKTRHIAGTHHLLRIDTESECPVEQVDDVLRYLQGYIGEAQWVIFSDYGKHFQQRSQEIIQIANEAKVPIAVDPKSDDWEKYRGADLITPNFSEFQMVENGMTPQRLLKKFGIKELVVTEGAQGMSHWTQKRKGPIHRDAIAQAILDPCGAGDTAVAAFVAGKVRRWSVENCLEYANEAAGQVCQKMGTHAARDVTFPVRKAA